VRVEPAPGPGWLFAAGELAMTASDLARWDIGMIQRKLLTSAGYTAQQTTAKLTDGKDTHYGLGLFVRDFDGHRIFEHGGEAVGFLSENIVAPDDGVAVAVLDNADFADAQTTIAKGILAMLLPDAKPAPKVADATARAHAILNGLAAGTIDRSQFTDHGSAYFTPIAIGDYKASLAPLGAPTGFRQLASALRGGFTEEVYEVSYASRKLTLIVRAEPGDGGRIEQFTAYPAS
jgi:hypothetical protein